MVPSCPVLWRADTQPACSPVCVTVTCFPHVPSCGAVGVPLACGRASVHPSEVNVAVVLEKEFSSDCASAMT